MGTFIVIVILLALVALCIRNLVREHKRGELCECIGDCARCKIQCRNSERYYGVLRDPGSEQTNGKKQ